MSIPKILIRFSLGVVFASIAFAPLGLKRTDLHGARTDSLGYNLPPDNILSVMRLPLRLSPS